MGPTCHHLPPAESETDRNGCSDFRAVARLPCARVPMITPAYLKAAAPVRAPSLNPSRNSELAAPPPKSPRSRRRRTRSAASVRREVSIPRAPPSRDERARALGGPFPPLCRAYGLTGVSRCRRRAHRPRCPARSSPALSACLRTPQNGAPSSPWPRPWRAAAAQPRRCPLLAYPVRGPRWTAAQRPRGRSTMDRWIRSTAQRPPLPRARGPPRTRGPASHEPPRGQASQHPRAPLSFCKKAPALF